MINLCFALFIVAYATQNTTSSFSVNLEQQNKNPIHCNQSVPVPSTAVPVFTKGVSSSAPKLACSKLSLKQTRTSDMATHKWSGDSRARHQCSAEEIELKKQEALRKRQALRLSV